MRYSSIDACRDIRACREIKGEGLEIQIVREGETEFWILRGLSPAKRDAILAALAETESTANAAALTLGEAA